MMSGTSMDGIDATLVKTNGKKLYENNIKVNGKYSNITKNLLYHSLSNFNILISDKIPIKNIIKK